MPLTGEKLMIVQNNSVKVEVTGPDIKNKYTGLIVLEGEKTKTIINSHSVFSNQDDALASMEEVVAIINDIKIDLSKNLSPIDDLMKINNLLRNEK